MDPTTNITNNAKRKYKKRRKWPDTAEQMLLEMWEDKIQQLRANRKNQHIYAEIAAELEKNNFSMSASDVNNKVHNLTARYRKEKLLVASGGSPPQWPLYSRLHSLLGSYRYYNLSEITCDSIPAQSAASTEAASTEAASFTYESILESMCTDESAASAPSTPTAASKTKRHSKVVEKETLLLQQQLKVQTDMYNDVKKSLSEIERYSRKTFQLQEEHLKLKKEKLILYKEQIKKKEMERSAMLKLKMQEIDLKRRKIEIEESIHVLK